MATSERTREAAVWAAADGTATPDQLALLEADLPAARLTFDRLIVDLEDGLDEVSEQNGPERAQIVADFEAELAMLDAAYDLLFERAPVSEGQVTQPFGEISLQASWLRGEVVVWAGGPGAGPVGNSELADRLEATGGPAIGWSVHPGVKLPGGHRTDALSIPLTDALGWFAFIGAGRGGRDIGPSVLWLGRVVLLATRMVARGAIVPTLRSERRQDGKTVDISVRWSPALLDQQELGRLTDAMPGPVTVLHRADARAVTLDVLGSAVHAIATDAASRLELSAPPPVVKSTANVAEAVATRLDGSKFAAPLAAGAEISKRLDRWTQSVLRASRPSLVVALDPPDRGNAWFLQVLGPGAEGGLLPIEVALADSPATKPLAQELERLERAYPVLLRAGGQRRGQVYLSDAEAWELLTTIGPSLEASGYTLRVPAMSRRKPAAGLRLFTEPTGDTVVGAHQLSNVRWSAVFDDVELTAAEVARLANEARPLVRSHGQWVELDKADLREVAAALAERAGTKQMTGAEILRHAVGLEGSALAGGLSVTGSGWASDLLEKATAVKAEPQTTLDGFVGELRSYQAEAVAWLGFLDAVELGGCLALDMGLGKTPTVLAHLARSANETPADGSGARAPLVIAPPPVVGNWAAEAARFAPGLRVVVHHGASRDSAEELERTVKGADVVITTYGTAVRDVEALSTHVWDRIILDEAQAIKNSSSETAQQLRRLKARTRIALTGTPVENGLGDLWSILDFTNPGLVGTRPTFVAQLAGEGEAALRALNGILVFRRTKSEPVVAAELPDRIDELDHCTMTAEQIGLYQAVLDTLLTETSEAGGEPKKGAVLAAITALKQICNHPVNYEADDLPLAGRSGKLARLEEIVESVFAAGERILIFTHFATWGMKLADHLSEVFEQKISCYHGGLARGPRDALIEEFQNGTGPGALVLSLKAGGTGLNLTAASHVVLYDRWWNPAVEDQARDRAWRIGQTRTVVSHRLVCPGTIDERVEEVVAGKRHIADLVLPKSSSLSDLNTDQLRLALGLQTDLLLTEEDT